MLDSSLSTQQLAVISALSNGVSMTAAAAQAGIHRNTISNWRRNLAPFQHALAAAQYDRAMLFREKVEELVDLAVQAIHRILSDSATPASIRLKAALAVVGLASKPPEPKQQIELILETHPAEMHNFAQPAAVTHASKVHNAAQSPAAAGCYPGRNP